MKIIKLQAENVKKLVAVEISPNGNMIAITGKNGWKKFRKTAKWAWSLKRGG